MKRSVVLAIALALSAPVIAEESKVSVILGGLSYHIGDRTYTVEDENGTSTHEESFNEVNDTFGLMYGDWGVAYSKLSYGNDGVVVFKDQKLASWFNHRSDKELVENWTVRLGVVYGYGDTPINMVLVPLIAPTYNWKLTEGLTLQTGMMITSTFVATANIKYTF